MGDRPTWLRRHLWLLVALDALAMIGATLLAKVLTLQAEPDVFHVRGLAVPYLALAVGAVPTWLTVLGTSGTYNVGPFGRIPDEMRRIVSAAAHFLALIAVAYYLVHLERLGRGFFILIIPLATAFTLTGRAVARALLHLQRTRGAAVRQALLLGPRHQTGLLATHLLTHPGAGVVPVAALVPEAGSILPAGHHEVPIIGTPDAVLEALGKTDADVLLITASLAPGELRKLTWQLEGSGVDVLVAPTVGHFTWPQLDVRPVAGLPLLYVDRLRGGGVTRTRA